MNKDQPNLPYINRSFQTGSKNNFSEEKILARAFQNVTFIIGEPGIGKSTTLRFLASKFDNEITKIFIDFSECPHNDLVDQTSDLYTSPIDYFFRRTNNTRDNLTAYEQDRTSGRLGIFLFGFDDIFRFYGEKTLSIIRRILREDCGVFIASSNDALPGNFKAKSKVIIGFDDNQIIKYLGCFNLSEEHAQRGYLNIPLHLEMYCKFHDNIKGDGLVDLYEAFINNEVGDFCKRFTHGNYDDNFKKIMDLHLNLAIIYTFGKEVVIEQGIITEEDITLMKETFNFYNFVGLVKVIHEDRIVFVHSCYSEYLTAKWLCQNDYLRNTTELANIFKCQKHQRIADFLNQIVNSKNPNSAVSAIISNDLDKVKTLCHDGDDCLLRPDQFGRFPTHIAAWYSQYNRLFGFYDAIRDYTTVKNKDILRSKDALLQLTCADYRNIKNIDTERRILKEIERLFEEGVHPDTIFVSYTDEVYQNSDLNHYYRNALVYSILHIHGGDTIVKLLKKGAHTETNFIAALEWTQSPEPLKILLKQLGDQINIDQFLHIAANTRSNNADEKLKLLLEHGANPDAKDDLGQEALHIAVLKKNRSPIPKVKILLQYGANPNHYNDDGQTSIHIAASQNYMCEGYLDQMRMLLENGGDPNLKDKYGRNALHLASTITLEESYEAIKLIIKKIDNINATDKEGKSSIHYAASSSFGSTVEKVKFLLEHGADPNQMDNSGKTSLHHAAFSQNDSTEKIRILLNLVDVNQLDSDGKSALHLASENQCSKSPETLKLLLENGGNPFIKDHHGKSPLHYATSIEKVKMLLDKGADPKESDNDGKNCLHHAALSSSYGSLEILKLYLEILDATLPDNNGQISLHHAALSESHDSFKKLELLLKKNADPNKTDNSGKHSLFIAVMSRKSSIKKIMLLLTNGASPNLKDVEGRTCLHYIAITNTTNNAISQVKLIFQHGGDGSIMDNYGKTYDAYCNPTTSIGRLLPLRINDWCKKLNPPKDGHINEE